MIHNALLVLETQSYRSACNVENKTWMVFFSVEKRQNCAISIFFSISLWWKLHLLCTMIEYKYTSWCICTPIDRVLNRRTRVPTKSSLQHMLGLQTRARNLSKKNYCVLTEDEKPLRKKFTRVPAGSRLTFVGNFIWGVPYMPCGTKLSSNKKPSQISRWQQTTLSTNIQ